MQAALRYWKKKACYEQSLLKLWGANEMGQTLHCMRWPIQLPGLRLAKENEAYPSWLLRVCAAKSRGIHEASLLHVLQRLQCSQSNGDSRRRRSSRRSSMAKQQDSPTGLCKFARGFASTIKGPLARAGQTKRRFVCGRVPFFKGHAVALPGPPGLSDLAHWVPREVGTVWLQMGDIQTTGRA